MVGGLRTGQVQAPPGPRRQGMGAPHPRRRAPLQRPGRVRRVRARAVRGRRYGDGGVPLLDHDVGRLLPRGAVAAPGPGLPDHETVRHQRSRFNPGGAPSDERLPGPALDRRDRVPREPEERGGAIRGGPAVGEVRSRHRTVRTHRRRRARSPFGLLLRHRRLRHLGRRGADLRPLGPREPHLHRQRLREPQHHRPAHGLRHHRRRARPRAVQDEEAGGRGHDDHRQPDRASGPTPPGLRPGPGRRDRRLHR